jgi:uncharacterized membrane protein YczE
MLGVTKKNNLLTQYICILVDYAILSLGVTLDLMAQFTEICILKQSIVLFMVLNLVNP